MTSPYVDRKAQKYSPGQRHSPGLGIVTYAPILCSNTSDGLRPQSSGKATPLAQASIKDQRKKQNPGFSL